ncbi:MAG TPA: DUF2970 domain-containing protein [Burkholderiales bacterium]|nr:DUF2970 domain-containing protein [Burkholderiales bacterium]
MEAAVAKASFLDTVKAVLSGFIGVRRKADHERAPLNPLHIVIAAVVLVALFIASILTVVRLVTS